MNKETKFFIGIGSIVIFLFILYFVLLIGEKQYNLEYCRNYFDTKNKAWIQDGYMDKYGYHCCMIVNVTRHKCVKDIEYTSPSMSNKVKYFFRADIRG